MAIQLTTVFLPLVDEKFTTESKKSLLTNDQFDWTGASTIKVYKIGTAPMNDYDRNGTVRKFARYGDIDTLEASTEEFKLTKDRSFTFAIDKLDEDETAKQLSAASALERQLREVAIPEIDVHVYSKMVAGAGTKPAAKKLTVDNIYNEVMEANRVLDNAEVPEDSRYLVVTPDVYTLIKKNKDFLMSTDIAQNMKVKGVVAMVDGVTVLKIPQNRLPENFGFMLCHPVATVAPTKLAEYKIHEDVPGISGSLVEGRINYDAFVLDNKVKAIYYQENK